MAVKRAFWLTAAAAGVLALAAISPGFQTASAGPDDEDVLPGKDPKLPLEEPRLQTIRDKVVQWFKEHATRDALPDDIAKSVDEAFGKTNNFRFAVGGELNDTGKPYMVECWDSRLYFFPLSDEQTSAIELKPLSLISYSNLTSQDAHRLATPLVRLEDVHYVRAGNEGIAADNDVTNEDKIGGQVTVKSNQAPAGKYTLRLSYRRGTAICQAYYNLDALPKDGGKIAFSFSPINEADDKDKFTGPMPFYLDLCKIVKGKDDTYETTIYSNTVGKLVDVEPLRKVAPGK
ncbi:MAG TPA: hypothetical protein VMS17_26580 [Gemmataceae bacterium]|nr:hypothetical protein [Gemmataceae bacterium]